MAKKHYKRAEKVFSISLGAESIRFESCHSDYVERGRFSNYCIEKRPRFFAQILAMTGLLRYLL